MAVVLARKLEGLRWVENSRPNNASRRHPMLVVRPLPIIQNRIQRRNLVRVRVYHTGTVTTDDDAITVIRGDEAGPHDARRRANRLGHPKSRVAT